MNETLLNEYFMDYIYGIVDKNRKLLRKIKPYAEHRKEYLRITENFEKKKDEEYLKLLSSVDGMTIYENAFAYYLGMLHMINMYELKNFNKE